MTQPIEVAFGKRVPLGKRVRFEVFKRDGFACQYCGAHPPAVVLHVDHIRPVADGGGNEADNLVTACEACNQGKGARLLQDAPQSLKDRAAEVVEREEQLRGYQAVLDAKRERADSEVEQVVAIYEDAYDGWTLSPRARHSVRHFVERLGFHSVREAMEIAVARQSDTVAFRYFCGICWTRIREAG